MKETQHLGDEQLLSFVERSAGVEQRRLIESHTADCESCRGRLVALWRRERGAELSMSVPPELRRRVDDLVPHRAEGRRSPVARSPWMRPPALAALAAALLAAVLVPSLLRAPDSARPALRGDSQPGLFESLSPADGAVLSRSRPLIFTWSAAVPGSGFRLVILDATGNRLLERETTAETLQVEASELGAGGGEVGVGPLYWTVTLLRADGSSSTGPQRRLSLVESPPG